MKKLSFLVLFGVISQLSYSQVAFQFYSFKTTTHYLLFGDAFWTGNNIRLTPSAEWQRGAVWYKKKVEVTGGFSVTFKMKISKDDPIRGGADGIAFVLHDDPQGLDVGYAGEGIGYAGIANSLAVEFDTYDNREGGNNHVSIHTNGPGINGQLKMFSIGMNHNIPNLRAGVKKVKIDYNGLDMTVFIDDKMVLTKKINLTSLLRLEGGRAWVGFTASTARGYSQHDLLDWQWESRPVPRAFLEIDDQKSVK